MQLAGIIALSDPPRPDAAELIKELHTLGVRTVMVTGDAPATAEIIAQALGTRWSDLSARTNSAECASGKFRGLCRSPSGG